MNALLNGFLNAFARLSPLGAFGWIVVENVALFLLVLLSGQLLIYYFRDRRVTPPPPPVERQEVVLSLLVLAVNCVVTYIGWQLWRDGIIRIGRAGGVWTTLGDALALLLLMDLAMYVLHRVAHHPALFPYLHRLHHRYDHPRPLTLFVMNPFEALAFGGLWLLVIWGYHATFSGIALYLAINTASGTIGHLGVEPLPAAWSRNGFFRHVGGSAFHAGHHVEDATNFGFYTTIWDRLFGTLAPAQK